MAFKSTARAVNIRQNSKPELIALNIDVSAIVNGTNAGLLEGSNYATLTKNGTGDITITLNRTARRNIIVVGAVAEAEAFVRLSTATTTSAVRVVIEDDAGTDTDADLHVTLLAFHSEHER